MRPWPVVQHKQFCGPSLRAPERDMPMSTVPLPLTVPPYMRKAEVTQSPFQDRRGLKSNKGNPRKSRTNVST